MKHNYHAHTPWSHHASITAEDSIKKAISLGFKTFGFSEHSLQDSISGDFRLRNKKELVNFLEEAKALKEKYKDQIEVKIGLEFDYRHEFNGKKQIDFLNETLKEFPEIEYVLYAPHYFVPQRHAFNIKPTKTEIDIYLNDMREALTTFDFAYIVHPDGYCKGMQEWNEDAIYLAEEITKMAAELNVPLGLNSNGLGYGIDFCYPYPKFWEVAAKNGAKAILELDSHSDRGISKERIAYIENIAKETGITVIEKLDI